VLQAVESNNDDAVSGSLHKGRHVSDAMFLAGEHARSHIRKMIRGVRAVPRVALVATVLVATSCGRDRRDTGATTNDSTSHTVPLIPATAGIDRVADLARDPSAASMPGDTQLTQMIRRGRDIMRDTRANAARYAGNDLSCSNCHLNVGQKDGAWPLVGVSTLFPQYRARSGRLITLEDRIRDCFVRSLNGSAPPFDSEELLAVSAYITWLAEGLPAGREPSWRGRNQIAKANLIAIDKLDVGAGRALFEKNCVACHGAGGGGVQIGNARPGPLWGAGSWNDGAGAARVYTLAGFIRYAMPLTAPGSLTDAEAQNLAAFINSHDRPAYRHKDSDYPDGRIPVDAVYYTAKYPAHPLRR
jgi:thiosulfate dehydrogenase